MLPIPYNSDAPLYHWPITTAGLIVLNFVLHFTVPVRFYYPAANLMANDQPEREEELAAPEQDRQEVVKLDAEDQDQVVAEAPQWANENHDWNQNEMVDPDQVEAGNDFQFAQPDHDLSGKFPDNTLVLQHGRLKPWQWFTSMFLHQGVVHLIINMLALWAFGLIVEGKVGSLVFLGLYLTMGACQAGVEQVMMIFSSSGGGSSGSTGAVLATLGICVIWAPKNEFDCFWAYGFRFGTLEIPVMMFGLLTLVVNLLFGFLISFFSVSAIFQLIGLPIGACVGLVWLKAKWVDCEGWDIVNVWNRNEGNIDKRLEMENEARQLVRSSMSATGKEKPIPEAEPAYFAPLPAPASTTPSTDQFEDLFNSVENATTTTPAPLIESLMEVMKLIDRNELSAASLMYQRVRLLEPNQLLPQHKLDRLMRGLLADRQFELSIPVMVEYAQRFTENRITVQLNLAKVYLHLQRPAKAIALLRSVDRDSLDESQTASFQKSAAHAKKMIDEGVVEFQ